MLTRHRRICAASAAVVFLAGTAHGNGIAVPDIAISTQNPASLGSVNFENDALVAYNPDTNVAQQLFDLEDAYLGVVRNVDAAHMLANGRVVISTQAGVTIAGVVMSESDLVELNPANGTASLLFDASAAGLVGKNNTVPNTNAVHVLDNGHILFSTASNDGVTFKGGTYNKDDVIEYDPVNDTASLFFDGSLITGVSAAIGFEANVMGFAVIDANHVLIAARDEETRNALTLGGVSFTPDDLVLYNTSNNTSTLFMEGLNEFSAPGEILDAVTPAVVPEPTSAGLLSLGVLAVQRKRR